MAKKKTEKLEEGMQLIIDRIPGMFDRVPSGTLDKAKLAELVEEVQAL